MVQTSADAASVIGGAADWGRQLTVQEFGEALRHALDAGRARFCLFPGEGMTAAHWNTVRTLRGAAHA
ncbi:hypothetical protein [Streptomyces sp. NBC_01615]|uniref:hypothetical protein n=1 Tax=Streptomyces sp. NBC_01615 TaxID=2975898 RepID=UPI00386F00D8